MERTEDREIKGEEIKAGRSLIGPYMKWPIKTFKVLIQANLKCLYKVSVLNGV